MKSHLILGFACLSLVLAARGETLLPAENDAQWLVVSSAASPRVAYRLELQDDGLLMVISAETFDQPGAGVSVEAGISADRSLRLSNKDGRVTRDAGTLLWEMKIPADKLIAGPTGWKNLRLAFAVDWTVASERTPRQKERFLHQDGRAAHAGLAADPQDWQPIDLDELRRQATDRSREIHLPFNQPLDGKATLVIEDGDGRRIRNLISAQAMEKGGRRIAWDGLDEAGNVVPPGKYRWRSISHPGLEADYRMAFADGPGSNHGTLQAATRNGTSLFFAAPVAEGGHEIVELAGDGAFVRGFNPPHGHGLNKVAIAADGDYLYAAHDGMAWGAEVDRSGPDWQEERTVSVMRIDLKKGTVAEFPGNLRFSPVRTYQMGPGSKAVLPLEESALAGLVLLNGTLYLADREADVVHVIDPETGKIVRDFPLHAPTALAASSNLYAISQNSLVEVDPANGATRNIAKIPGKPAGLAIGGDGRFFASDSDSHVIHIFDSSGTPSGTLGRPGGIVPGPYEAGQLHQPAGLIAHEGKLWFTELDRWTPKRLAAFDLATGEVAEEFFGPTAYGASDSGFDDQDATRWIAQDTLFELDFATGKARPLAILGGKAGRRHQFWRQDGRTFVISSGKATFIQELMKDNTMRPLACLSSAHQFSYLHNWNPPRAFVEAFQKAYPDTKYGAARNGGIESGKPDHGYGMLWVDRSGDGVMQSEEIEFATLAANLAGSGWSHDFFNLTIKVPAEADGRKLLVTLEPNGWWPGGAPKYPALNDALKTAVPIDLPGTNQIETTVDRFGNIVMNSDPAMRAFSPDGKLLWTYPNRWSGVHGSHNAPLPRDGELQGVLFFSGVAPLDAESDVMAMNGNHGRAFFMTTDGLYLDEVFSDVRLMNNAQAGGIGILGGECFGGTFGQSSKDGRYYYQGGGITYRIYQVTGLDQTRRQQGTLNVSADQAIAAERDRSRKVSAAAAPLLAEVGWAGEPPGIDGSEDDWPAAPTANWHREGKYPVTIRAARDEKMLYLHYAVADDSPWVNRGKDWQSLFKTGDGIDLQLGTDPSANPQRTGPSPGDLRLFIAPSAEGDVAVLYRHRLPNADDAESVVFQSPWRSEKVDSVRRLESARIAVRKDEHSYGVEAAIPLEEFGFDVSAENLLGDFGIIYGNGEGTVNVFRNYWSNRTTGLVNDVPGEIMLSPNLWSDIRLKSAPAP